MDVVRRCTRKLNSQVIISDRRHAVGQSIVKFAKSLSGFTVHSAGNYFEFGFVQFARACVQLGGLCMRTDQNQTRNAVLFCSAAGTLGIPKSVVE
jgi:hypothetical protein